MKRDKAGTGNLAEVADPSRPMETFSVKDAIAEMQASVTDSGWFCNTLARNERTRLCWWTGKNGTGRKRSKANCQAEPWDNAADHEVHLTEELLRERTAMRLAALMRGALSVMPQNMDDSGRAGRMKQVLRYYMNNRMGRNLITAALRLGNWADRAGHALVQVYWKEERGVERKTLTAEDLRTAFIERRMAEASGLVEMRNGGFGPDGAGPSGVNDLGGNAIPPSGMGDAGMPGGEFLMDEEGFALDFEERMMADESDPELVELVLEMDAGLMARGKAGEKEAARVIDALKDRPEVEYTSSFVRCSQPCWEALMPFVDVFYPAETCMDDGLGEARWIARVQWLSGQQIREQAEIYGWDKAWVEEVLTKHRGRPKAFTQGRNANQGNADWMLSGAGVRWMEGTATTETGTVSGVTVSRSLQESEKNLYQIVRLWDRATTPDGLTAVYETVLHADVPDKVATRDLLEHWDGQYPFDVLTCEMTERLLLQSRGIAEMTKTPQDAIKAQWDSRTDMASLTTVPPWTGPPELAGTKIRPGMFIEQWRAGSVSAFNLPNPDGRSIEIEKTIRASVNQLFGRKSADVPDEVAMVRQQAEMDWFLLSVSRLVQLTARLVQQFMPPLTGARIMGTDEVVTASRDDVRGSYDYSIAFDVRSLDLDWAKGMLEFINQQLVPLDQRSQIVKGPLLEFGFNILHPSLAATALRPADEAMRDEEARTRQVLAEVFSGGTFDRNEDADHATRAQVIVQEIQKSPMRQEMLRQNAQIRAVVVAMLQHHVESAKQYDENAQTGRLMAEDPLRQPTEAEAMLMQLEGAAV